MHSPSEDLVAFKHACGVVPKPLFDTQLAAALAGIGAGLGYQKLVEQLTGVALAKGETRSDWLRRPLSPAQLEYAADDVRHLDAMHDDLDGMLDTLAAPRLAGRGRRAPAGECRERDARALAAPVAAQRAVPRARRAAPPAAPAALARCLRRDNDRPRNWILDNELAVTLARSSALDRAGLQQQLDAHPKAPRKLGDAIWQALQHAAGGRGRCARLDARREPRQAALRKLQDAVSARSAELGLPDGVLASRRWLRGAARRPRWPGALAGWRRAALEPRLAPLLAAGGGPAGDSHGATV